MIYCFRDIFILNTGPSQDPKSALTIFPPQKTIKFFFIFVHVFFVHDVPYGFSG